MKSYTCVLALVLVAAVQGFAPVSQGRAGSQLSETLFDRIANMDLFAPKADQNTYGARNKKNLKVGSITSKSYVPQGMTAKQYSQLRATEQKKKDANYKRNVAKAGVFEDYTEFYMKRGTDTKQEWAKNKNTLGHRMAKTKYDWSGKKVAATTTAAVEVNTRKKRLGKK